MKSINIYSTKNINIISAIISITILLIINFIISIVSQNNIPQNSSEQAISEKIIEQNKTPEQKTEEEKNTLDWYIEISSIKLIAPIKETTEMKILNKYVGHFEETPLKEGNIGLAAHNRGYEKNYFENVNKIKKGEKIKYKYYDFEKTYIVDKIQTIKNTDWSLLENTTKNKITLITCIENKPNERLCVQATEEK